MFRFFNTKNEENEKSFTFYNNFICRIKKYLQSSGSIAEIGSIKANISFILLLILHRKLSNSVLCTEQRLKFNRINLWKQKFHFPREMLVVVEIVLTAGGCQLYCYISFVSWHVLCSSARQCQGTPECRMYFLDNLMSQPGSGHQHFPNKSAKGFFLWEQFPWIIFPPTKHSLRNILPGVLNNRYSCCGLFNMLERSTFLF